MRPETLFARYQDLQTYVGWSPDDALRVGAVAPLVRPSFDALVDDFYREIDQHPEARKVITGGADQIRRLKRSLHDWLDQLFAGDYDLAYVQRRWSVGTRHVEIGLQQIYTNAALSRLRTGLIRALTRAWGGETDELLASISSLNRLLDLDLAIIEDAYQSAYFERQQQSDRLAAIGQVAGGIAHELRNPLNVIKTSVYYLLNARQPSPQKVSDHLQRVERQVGLADQVITALNDFARLPIPLLRSVAVEPFLRDVLETAELPEKISVRTHVAADVPAILADAAQLRIVFGNLIRNARDAMPDGGQLGITVQVAAGERVEVRVSDTGVGIATTDLDRVMEPLYSTKARGIGLGLAITRAIVEKHDGRIHVLSEPGRGSQFTVTLAAAAGAAGEREIM